MNVEKFSVVADGNHQFVHVFKANQNNRVYVKCCSGICSRSYSKLMILHTMEEVDLCPHLTLFKSYMDTNWQKHRLLRILRNQFCEVEEENEDNDTDEMGEAGDLQLDFNDLEINAPDDRDSNEELQVSILIFFPLFFFT